MGPPLSFDVGVGVNDVTFTWSLPEPTLRNGLITGFTLFCVTGGALMLRQSFPAPNNHSLRGSDATTEFPYKVSGFSASTAYNCSVLATNSKGNSPPASLGLTTLTAPTVTDSEFGMGQ